MDQTEKQFEKNEKISIIVGNPALLIIDMQYDFLDGTFITVSPNLIPNTRKLLESARSVGIPVIHTKECHRPGRVDMGIHELKHPTHCVEGTKGIEIVDELTPIIAEYIIPKRRWNSFLGTDLDILLKNLGVDTLIVCGVVASYCVLFTAAEAHQRDFHVRLVEDCTNSDTNSARAAIELIREMTTKYPITHIDMIDSLKDYLSNTDSLHARAYEQ